MSNNGWKEDLDLSPQERKEYAEQDRRQNLHRFRDKQTGYVRPEPDRSGIPLGDNSVPSYADLLAQRMGRNSAARGEDRILIGTVPNGLFDPPDRPLTPAEKADPMTFFGVTYEMRAERLKALEEQKPTHADKFKERAKARTGEMKRDEQERDR